MRKKTKKQPYRNALLKLTKERSSLDSLYKENQRLNANLLYKQKEAHSLLTSAAMDKEKAEKYFDNARKELQTVNPYHPDLMSVHTISDTFRVEDVLRYRMAMPTVHWDDFHQQGIVKLVYHKQGGGRETVAFGFSEAYIKDDDRYINADVIEDMGKAIATELVALANKKMKEW
jgi:hypothetical protein